MKDYTIKEASSLLGLKENSIRTMIAKNIFRFSTYKEGVRRMIDKEEVDQYLRDLRPPTPEVPKEIVAKTPKEIKEEKARIEKRLKERGLL